MRRRFVISVRHQIILEMNRHKREVWFRACSTHFRNEKYIKNFLGILRS